jgi:hypothetical protein
LNLSLLSSEILKSTSKVEETDLAIKILLNKLNPDKYADRDKTSGFQFRYESLWNSPFQYNIYIGKVSKTSNESLIRIESKKRGEELVWKQIIDQEILKNPPQDNARTLENKYHMISQGFNLVSPAFSVLYNSTNSPMLSNRDAGFRIFGFAVYDLIVGGLAYYYIDKKNESPNALEKALGQKEVDVFQSADAPLIFSILLAPRIYHTYGAWENTESHNRLLQFGYKFKF